VVVVVVIVVAACAGLLGHCGFGRPPLARSCVVFARACCGIAASDRPWRALVRCL
jgi:hypothetical protein